MIDDILMNESVLSGMRDGKKQSKKNPKNTLKQSLLLPVISESQDEHHHLSAAGNSLSKLKTDI